MRVGFDVQVLRRNRGGTAVYTQSLLDALRRLYPADEYVPLDSTFRLPRRNMATKLGNALFELYYLHALLPLKAKRAQVDLVHFPANMVSARLHCPSVVTIHDMMVEHMPEAYDPLFLTFFKRFVPPSARRATRIITDSEFSRRDIVRYCRVPARKVHVAHLGVAPGFAPQDPHAARAYIERQYCVDARPIVLFVSELNPRKNVANLVRAFAEVRRSQGNPPCQLVLVGEKRDPMYYGQLVDLVKRERVAGDVRFVGYVPSEDLTAFYAAASVFAYVSLYEGFGLPAVEAMMSGVPVLASNRTSLPEVVGDAGVLVDPEDVPGMADGLRALMSDDALRTRLVAAGYKRSETFTWERTAQITHRVYEQALKR
ncbi:MAG TPA: glycosyltransferase family 1 protein [Chloroflexia bacterium]|nr:glycosyltransferase family 1 protein [Chloroflexia bacterium]